MYKIKIWVAQRLSRTAPCRVLYSSTCIDCWPLLTQGVYSHLTIRGSYSPRPNPLSGFPVGHRSVDIYRISSFFRWVWSSWSFSTPTVASILWLRIKTPPRPFWGKHGRLVTALEWLWQSLVWFLLPAYLLRWGYRFPLSIRFGETLEPVSDENLARGVHNSASFIVDTLYFLEQEKGNKRERRESNLQLKIFGKADQICGIPERF